MSDFKTVRIDEATGDTLVPQSFTILPPIIQSDWKFYCSEYIAYLWKTSGIFPDRKNIKLISPQEIYESYLEGVAGKVVFNGTN